VTVTSLLNKSTWSTAVERARLISSPPPFCKFIIDGQVGRNVAWPLHKLLWMNDEEG
jgi:hypothetical protein